VERVRESNTVISGLFLRVTAGQFLRVTVGRFAPLFDRSLGQETCSTALLTASVHPRFDVLLAIPSWQFRHPHPSIDLFASERKGVIGQKMEKLSSDYRLVVWHRSFLAGSVFKASILPL